MYDTYLLTYLLDFQLVGHCKYSCMLYHSKVIWRWIIVTLKRSLKIIQTGTIRKLGCGFLFAFHSNYGRIFNRLWDIQSQSIAWPWKLGWSCSRSLKSAPFDRPHTTFYWPAVVNIELSGTVFELFDVDWYHDLQIWVRGHSRSFKPVPFENLGAVSYSPFIVTMALFGIMCEIKRDIGRKSRFFIPPLHSMPLLGVFPSEYCHPVWYGKTGMVGLRRRWKNFEDMTTFRQNSSVWQTDGRTDRQSAPGVHNAVT